MDELNYLRTIPQESPHHALIPRHVISHVGINVYAQLKFLFYFFLIVNFSNFSLVKFSYCTIVLHHVILVYNGAAVRHMRKCYSLDGDIDQDSCK